MTISANDPASLMGRLHSLLFKKWTYHKLAAYHPESTGYLASLAGVEIDISLVEFLLTDEQVNEVLRGFNLNGNRIWPTIPAQSPCYAPVFFKQDGPFSQVAKRVSWAPKPTGK